MMFKVCPGPGPCPWTNNLVKKVAALTSKAANVYFAALKLFWKDGYTNTLLQPHLAHISENLDTLNITRIANTVPRRYLQVINHNNLLPVLIRPVDNEK